jgi:hypothetical protein
MLPPGTGIGKGELARFRSRKASPDGGRMIRNQFLRLKVRQEVYWNSVEADRRSVL